MNISTNSKPKSNSSKCSVRDLCQNDLCKNPRKSATLPCPFKEKYFILQLDSERAWKGQLGPVLSWMAWKWYLCKSPGWDIKGQCREIFYFRFSMNHLPLSRDVRKSRFNTNVTDIGGKGESWVAWCHSFLIWYTVKKTFWYYRPQPVCHLPNSPWAGMKEIIRAQGVFGKWHPGWGREYRKAFLRCILEYIFIPSHSYNTIHSSIAICWGSFPSPHRQ